MRIAGLFLLLWFCTASASTRPGTASPQPVDPGTFELTSISALRSQPDGLISDVWPAGTRFTSGETRGDWLKVTGYFPDEQWKPVETSLWVRREYAQRFTPQPTPPKQEGPERYIVIDKSDFTLSVFEKRAKEDKLIYHAKVALGMDRCLPASEGGRCYYTEPGEYHVRWKVYDPEGIEWCIPKSMEEEYAQDIAAGKRCFRGAIGTRALNIGKTYAIHGTSNPRSIGRKVSHGCIRTKNQDMKRIYRLMTVGDKVLIVDQSASQIKPAQPHPQAPG